MSVCRGPEDAVAAQTKKLEAVVLKASRMQLQAETEALEASQSVAGVQLHQKADETGVRCSQVTATKDTPTHRRDENDQSVCCAQVNLPK